MRFQMQQKFFSFGDFTITDEAGNDAFAVDCHAFVIGKELSLNDLSGRELAFIKKPAFSFSETYDISRDGELLATIHKPALQFFKHSFEIEGPDANGLSVEGDFFELEYTFARNGTTVAQASKEYFSFSDSYGVDIADGEDPVLILATCVVIDMACHSDND
ncbi:LURP-one-related/scramblase family protein [Tenggerimyces flavus]|uniref:LURP-one-related/scramblase family protein n=1 Tax=Tenggerimyces flavus TaxID=1708749 RepID=A0ABV7YLQ4_9ACTN|nr:LURP-one-related family protein [Tenggerimyces flavus]MBM7787655.1 uncharacterized protein YxjI [Tenggerimyces flavus]